MHAEAWADRLTPQERRVNAYLRRKADDNGDVTETFKQIAAGAVIAESQVKPALDGLIALGLLERRGTVSSAKGHWRNAYRCLRVFVETTTADRAEITAPGDAV